MSEAELLVMVMGGIETFIILAMTSFHLAIVPGCKRLDQLMLYRKTVI